MTLWNRDQAEWIIRAEMNRLGIHARSVNCMSMDSRMHQVRQDLAIRIYDNSVLSFGAIGSLFGRTGCWARSNINKIDMRGMLKGKSPRNEILTNKFANKHIIE